MDASNEISFDSRRHPVLLAAVTASIWLAVAPIRAADVTVDVASTKQVIDGFGASSAWCGTIGDAVMNSLYGDLGFSILRVRIEEGIGDNWKTGNFDAFVYWWITWTNGLATSSVPA
jgi:O-glycosyl hydrolase